MRELLIDGDVITYMFAHRAQETVRFHRDLYVSHARMDRARAEIGDWLITIQEELEADVVRVALSDLDSNFRHEVYPSYKGNRAGTVRPMLFRPIRKWLEEEHGARWYPRLEGDDVLGIWATEANPEGHDRIVCTIDKDLRTVPGLLYNWDRTDGVEEIDEYEAALYHMSQVLTGDRTDGYPGCPGVGPVKMGNLLGPLEPAYAEHGLERWTREAWAVVVAAFEKVPEGKAIATYGVGALGEKQALQNAQVAHILQAGDYDMATNGVRLWTPAQGDE